MLLTQRNEEIETFSPQRANEPLAQGIRLRALWRRFENPKPQVAYALVKLGSEDAIAIMHQESVGVVSGNRFAKLQEGPRRGRFRRDIGMYDAARDMFHDDEDINQAKGCCHYDAEVACDDRLGMIAQKGLPSLGRCALPSPRVQALRQILAYSAWRHAQTQFE